MIALIIDTETTGLIENHTIPLERQPRVIEFCGFSVDLRTGKIKEELDVLIKPPEPLSPKIVSITGITDEMLRDKLAFGGVADKIFGLVSRSKVVIAHNLSFDAEMLDMEAERLGRKIAWPKKKICTVEATVHLDGHRLSLSVLHQKVTGEKHVDAHRARADVTGLVRICRELRKKKWRCL